MRKKRASIISVLLAGAFALNFSQISAFAAEEEDGSTYTEESSEVIEQSTETMYSELSNIETSLEDGTVTLTLTPGSQDEGKVEITSYTVDEMTIPEGLSGGDKDDPAQLVEVGTDENGNEVSVVTTAEYDENGNISGYTVSAKTSEESEPVESEQSVKVETTETEAEDSWHLVLGEDGLYYLVSAKMWNIMTGENNGVVDVQTVQPTEMEACVSGLALGKWNTSAMLGNIFDEEADLENGAFDEYSYRFVGYGPTSGVKASLTKQHMNLETAISLFKLADSEGNIGYAYCDDLSTEAQLGSGYNMKNVEEASYYDADAAAHIKVIAENGYWGTAEGVGSLESVKQLLRDYSDLSEQEISALTPGIAMSATQTAIWYYGNSDKKVSVDYDTALVKYSVDPYRSNYTTLDTRPLSDAQAAAAKTLLETLIHLDPNAVEDTSSTIITKDNFATEASIILKGQDTDNLDLFDTDITFTLEMVPSDQDDLVVIVRDSDGQIVTVRRLAGALKEGETMASATRTESGMVYTLEDIPLTDGVSVSLNLSGVQNLDLGAYLYSADVYSDSQTFVGLASGKKNVDLSVQLDFSELAPMALVQHDSSVTVTKGIKETSLITEDVKDEDEDGQEESNTGTETPEEEEPVDETEEIVEKEEPAKDIEKTSQKEEPVEEVEETVEEAAEIVEEVEEGAEVKEEKAEQSSKTSAGKVDTAVHTVGMLMLAIASASALGLLRNRKEK